MCKQSNYFRTLLALNSLRIRVLLASIILCFIIVYSLSSNEQIGEAMSSLPIIGRFSTGGTLRGVIDAVERHCLPFSPGGHMLLADKQKSRRVARNERELFRLPISTLPDTSNEITSCLIHSFSPYVEREAAKRFLDPPHQHVYYANSPAIAWDSNGDLVLVIRIWLELERYEVKNKWPANKFPDNWFYTQRFDRQLRPLTPGSLLGIPAPKQWTIGDGPIEPRLFRTWNGRLLVSFNTGMSMSDTKFADLTVWWDMQENVPFIPHIHGGSPTISDRDGEMGRDKHWSAFTEPNDDNLYFVHTLDPLRILRCRYDGDCRFVQRDDRFLNSSAGFNDMHIHLRGGTPFELYKWPYYISFAHATMFKYPTYKRYYTTHMVVMCVRPFYRLVYVSDPIRLHRAIYRSAPIVRYRYIEDGFAFPVGLIIEDDDSLAIGLHVSDYSSVIVRLKGINDLMHNIIEQDKSAAAGGPQRRGSPVGTVQRLVVDMLVNITGTQMVHDPR